MGYKYFRMAYVYDVPLDEGGAAQTQTDAENTQEEADPFAGHYEFYGVWDEDSADSIALPSRNVREMASCYGYQIQTAMAKTTLPDMDDAGVWLSKQFTLNANVEMSTKVLPRGKYAMVFQVTDVFGKTQMTDPIYISWDGAKVTYSGAEVISEATEATQAAQ